MHGPAKNVGGKTMWSRQSLFDMLVGIAGTKDVSNL